MTPNTMLLSIFIKKKFLDKTSILTEPCFGYVSRKSLSSRVESSVLEVVHPLVVTVRNSLFGSAAVLVASKVISLCSFLIHFSIFLLWSDFLSTNSGLPPGKSPRIAGVSARLLVTLSHSLSLFWKPC